MTRSAALSILPWGVNVVCTNLAGWLGDKAINERGLDRTLVRKVMQGIASLGPAACLLALASDQGAPLPLRFPYRPHHPKSILHFCCCLPHAQIFHEHLHRAMKALEPTKALIFALACIQLCTGRQL